MNEKKPCSIICTVGTGRDREDIAKAILFSIQHHAADRAVFLCSQKTRDETLPHILDGWTDAENRYVVDICPDPDDVQALFIRWNERWSNWVPADVDGRVIVDFTSGTKPMSAAAFALAVARGADTVSYVTGPRDSTGRVSESKTVQALAPMLIVAHRQLCQAVDHFHAGSYAAAAGLAAPLRKAEALPDERLRAIAESVYGVAAAYEAWDRFDWKAARNAVWHKHGRFERTTWPWLDSVEQLRENGELIRAAEDVRRSQVYRAEMVADLLGNVKRCLDRHDWDDALARLYRACEMLAQLKLLRDHDLRTGDVDVEKLPESVRPQYQKRKDSSPIARVKLGLEQAYTLLEELGDPLGAEFRKVYGDLSRPGPLRAALTARNDSLLAHGIQPIPQQKAEQLYEHVLALARQTDPAILDEWLPKATPVRFHPF